MAVRVLLRNVAISLSILFFYSASAKISCVDAFLHVRPLSLGGISVGNGLRSKVGQQQRQSFQQVVQQRESTLLGWKSNDLSWKKRYSSSPSSLFVSPEDLALVLGQETYGFGIVVLAEGIYSFSQAPSLGQVKVLLPGIFGAVGHTRCIVLYCFVCA
jgi:hypothetical protein